MTLEEEEDEGLRLKKTERRLYGKTDSLVYFYHFIAVFLSVLAFILSVCVRLCDSS